MAERRMFSKTIIDSDLFMDLPVEAQVLYFHLGMRADDDGFIGNSKKLCRMLGLGEENLEVLIEKELLIKFDSGVIAVKHWKEHNKIRKDRYKATIYLEEKKALGEESGKLENEEIEPEKASDNQVATKWQPNDNQMATQDRLGKDSIGKDSIGKDSIGKDSIDYISPLGDIAASAARSACAEQSNKVDFSFSSDSAEQPTQNSYSATSAAPMADKGDVSADTPKADKGDAYVNDTAREPDTLPKAEDDAPRFDNLVPEENTKDPEWQDYLTDAREILRRTFGAPKHPKKPDTKPRYGNFDPDEAFAAALARTEYEFAKMDKDKSS